MFNYADATLLPNIGPLLHKTYPEFAKQGWNSELVARLHDYGELLNVIKLYEKCGWEQITYKEDTIELHRTDKYSTREGTARINYIVGTPDQLSVPEQLIIRVEESNARVISFRLVKREDRVKLKPIPYSLLSIYSTPILERLVLGKNLKELRASSIALRTEVEEMLGATLDAYDLITANCQTA